MMLKSSVFSKVFSKVIFVTDDGTLVNAVVGSGFGLQQIRAINSNIAVGSRCPKDNSQVTYYVS